MKTIYIFLILCIFSIQATSQKLMNVSACIEYAIENNLSLKGFHYDVQRQEAQMAGAYGSMMPAVSARSGLNIFQGRTTDPNTGQVIDTDPFLSNSYGLNGNMLLFHGFRLQNQLKFQKYRLLSTQEVYEQQKNDIAFQVIDAYTQYLISEGMTRIQSEQLEASKTDVYRIKKQIELGLSAGADLYESQAQMANDEFLLVQNRNLANRNMNNLKQLLNFPVDSILHIADIEIEDEKLMTAEVQALEPNPNLLPQVKSTMALLNGAQKQLKVAQSQLSPQLTAFAGWNTSYLETRTDAEGELIPYSEQLNLNSNIGYGLSLSIPIFNQLSRRTNIQQAKIDYLDAENNLTTILRDTEYLINEAILDYQGAIAEYRSARQREASMELAFEVAEKSREKGLIGIMEYYLAKNNLANARGTSLQTKLQLYLSERNIRFYLTGSFFE